MVQYLFIFDVIDKHGLRLTIRPESLKSMKRVTVWPTPMYIIIIQIVDSHTLISKVDG